MNTSFGEARDPSGAALTEFGIRWSELVSLQTELNRWRTLYIAAALAGAAGTTTRPGGLAGIAQAHPFALLAMAWLNAVFAASQVFNTWSLHQIGIYCYEVLRPLVTTQSQNLLSWDRWRRTRFDSSHWGGPDRLRKWFGALSSVTPGAISGILLFYPVLFFNERS